MASHHSEGVRPLRILGGGPGAGVIAPGREDRETTSVRTLARRLATVIEGHEQLYGSAVVLSVAAVSLAVSMQGWRSRIPAFDLLTYHYGIREFLETGALLQHGDIGSYGSFKPPGTAWLMLPGVLLLDDPRLTDYVGTALLHLSTLAGLYLLARRFFGWATATLTVVLYGLSEHGLFLAGSLWPNGRPDFYVWAVYFAIEWATRRKAAYLALSLSIWALGMHVDMALLPVVLIFPLLWLFYRPPLRVVPVAAAGAVVLLVWMPYLGFEAARDFRDIRSQVLQQDIRPTSFESAWCNPALVLEEWSGSAGSEAVRAGTDETAIPLALSSTATGGLAGKLLSNFQFSYVPGADVTLFLLTAAGILFASVSGAPRQPTERAARTGGRRRSIVPAGRGLALSGLLIGGSALIAVVMLDVAHPTLLSLVDKLQRSLVFGGLGVLAGCGLVAVTDRLLMRHGVHVQSRAEMRETRALVLCLLAPWFLLLLFAEQGKRERFMWLWTLQSLFLAAFLIYVLPRLKAPRLLNVAGGVIAVVLVAGNYFLVERVESWLASGWSGEDAAAVQVVDAVSEDLLAQGRDRAPIGYQVFVYPFMVNDHITNPLYKAGADIDFVFSLRQGIINTNSCAEGISPSDEFRIVQTQPEVPDWAPRHYFPAELGSNARLLGTFGAYEVYRVDSGPGEERSG